VIAPQGRAAKRCGPKKGAAIEELMPADGASAAFCNDRDFGTSR
jgi:hypothetical protein